MKKKIPSLEFKMLKKAPYQHISWIENNKKIPKSSPTWSNKRENKRQESGLFLLKKSNP